MVLGHSKKFRKMIFGYICKVCQQESQAKSSKLRMLDKICNGINCIVTDKNESVRFIGIISVM